MTITVPDGAMCFAQKATKNHGNIFDRNIEESHSSRSVADRREMYREEFTDKKDGRTAEPKIDVYFEPTVGKYGTFYFIIVPGKVTGIVDQF